MHQFIRIENLVSIITPCYNGANLIHRLLDSVLIQDYPSIQMIVVDDGSSDNSKNVILSYKCKFEEKGYSLTYMYQDNAGQSAAINNALKRVEGEYLCWPDCDDFYNLPTSISKFVSALTDADETYGIARTIGDFLNEKELRPVDWGVKWCQGEKLFDSCLLGRNFLMVPINYMVRMSAFDEVNPTREIYTGRRPQNFQMFEPILFSYKCITIDETLCSIVIRDNSDSHSRKTYSQQLEDIKGYLDIQLNTLDKITQMDAFWKNFYKKQVNELLYGEQLSLALRCLEKDDSRTIMKIMRQNKLDVSNKRIIKYYLLINCPLLLKFFNKISR